MNKFENNAITFMSILHMLSGIIGHRIGLKFYQFLILHTIWELFENTKYGILITNWFIKYIYRLNNTVYNGDSILNLLFDFIFAIIGYKLSELFSFYFF